MQRHFHYDLSRRGEVAPSLLAPLVRRASLRPWLTGAPKGSALRPAVQVFWHTTALIRIRRSCPALRSSLDLVAQAAPEAGPQQMSYWKMEALSSVPKEVLKRALGGEFHTAHGAPGGSHHGSERVCGPEKIFHARQLV